MTNSTGPSVLLAGALEVTRGNGIGKNKKTRALAARRTEPLQEELVLPIQDRLKPLARYVARGGAINILADGLVVRRYGFRDRARGRPTLRNQRATSWPAPISANVP